MKKEELWNIAFEAGLVNGGDSKEYKKADLIARIEMAQAPEVILEAKDLSLGSIEAAKKLVSVVVDGDDLAVNIKKVEILKVRYQLGTPDQITFKQGKETYCVTWSDDNGFYNFEKIEEGSTELPKLTALEIKFVNAMRDNELNDALQEYPTGTWTFAAIDNSGMTEKVARGVISSLVQKGLIKSFVGKGLDNGEDPSSVDFTELGTHLFDKACVS